MPSLEENIAEMLAILKNNTVIVLPNEGGKVKPEKRQKINHYKVTIMEGRAKSIARNERKKNDL